MKLTAKVKLLTTPAQAAALRETLRAANRACNAISRVAWDQRTYRAFDLHHATYHDVRRKFGLPAQLAVRALAKVADAYTTTIAAAKQRAKRQAEADARAAEQAKAGVKPKRTRRGSKAKPTTAVVEIPRCRFGRFSAFPLDNRLLSWKVNAGTVSVLTLAGRITVPFVAGPQQRELLAQQHGETDLILHNGTLYLSTTCDVDEALVLTPSDVLGVDFGLKNLAYDSDGTAYSGAIIAAVRERHRALRTKLQAANSRSATRHLKRLSGRERRFATNTNHVIAKRLVSLAEGTDRALALEHLTGINGRTTVRRQQRAARLSWAFFQLRTFVEYKALRAGVPVLIVSARNTSRTCPRCGHIDTRNRPSQDRFRCRECSYAAHADFVGATNIRDRGRAALSTSPSSRPAVTEVAPTPPSDDEQRQAAAL